MILLTRFRTDLACLAHELQQTMQGIFITSTTLYKVHFDSPSEVFKDDNVTFIGACVEKGLVFMGRTNASDLPINTNIPLDLLSESCFDEPPRGEVLIVKTNDSGEIIECDLKL